MHYSLARICLCIAANLRFRDPCTIICSVVDAFTFSVVLHNDISCFYIILSIVNHAMHFQTTNILINADMN